VYVLLNDIPRSLFMTPYLLGLFIILVTGACSGDADESRFSTAQDATDVTTKVPEQAGSSGRTSGKMVEGFPFPTGPVSVVTVAFNPPRDHVASTGAYLPVNGKPTLVFVDSIW
jgi:hypothetical protein